MARLLYGVTPADYVINGTTGLPASGVRLDVFASIGAATPITDLLGVSGSTYTAGSAITFLTSNTIGMYPFYAPDGETGTLALRASDGAGGYNWWEIGPGTQADLLKTLSGTVATLVSTVGTGVLPATPASPTTKYLRGDNTWQTLPTSSITGAPGTWPVSFPPSPHTHNPSDVLTSAAVQALLAAANNAGILSAIGAQAVITGAPSTWPTSFPPSSHSHAISDVTGLQTALDGKAVVFRATGDDSDLTAALGSAPAGYSGIVAVKIAGS